MYVRKPCMYTCSIYSVPKSQVLRSLYDVFPFRFQLVGYGCMTCIGNSGPLPEEVVKAIEEMDLVAVGILSGNR